MSEAVRKLLAEHFVPSAAAFGARLLRRVPFAAVPQLAVVYIDRGRDHFAVALEPAVEAGVLADLESDLAATIAALDQKSLMIPARTVAAGQLVERRLASAPGASNRKWYVSVTQWIGADLVVAVGLPTAERASVPEAEVRDGVRISFVDSVVQEFVRAVGNALATTSSGWSVFSPRASVEDLLRDGGEAFVNKVMGTLHENALHDVFGNNVFERMNRIATLKYEGDDVRGVVVFGMPESLELDLEFVRRVPLSDAVWARKVVELCSGEHAVLATDSELLGLGSARTAETRFNVQFRGKHTWILRHGTTKLVQVQLSVPHLPTPRLTQERFATDLQRVLGPNCDVGALWKVVQTAMGQRHGTMVVVTAIAADEAERLAGQGMPLKPELLDANSTLAVTGIDGAMLVDGDGRCHAIGVILDGLATPNGTPARGARFNSALRYVESHKEPVLVVVVSEDGYVDLIPRLRPQIRKSDFDQLKAMARGEAEAAAPEARRAACQRLLKDYWDYLDEQDRDTVRVGVGLLHWLTGDDDDDRFPTKYSQHPSDVID